MNKINLFKSPKGTSVLVLPPRKKTWINHISKKVIAFGEKQILHNEDFNIDKNFIVVNLNYWIVAVPKETISCFSF